jgi:hypothetical protein
MDRQPKKPPSELKDLSVMLKKAQEMEVIRNEIRRLEKATPSEQKSMLAAKRRQVRCQACHHWKDAATQVSINGHLVHRCPRDEDEQIIDCRAYHTQCLDDCPSGYKHGHQLITLKAKGNRLAASAMKMADKVEKKRIQAQHRFQDHPSHHQHMYHITIIIFFYNPPL